MALKARVILAKLKFLSRFLNADDMAKVVTSHLFGFMYYGLQAWLNELTTSAQWRKLNSIHYCALRICLKDFRNKISKSVIDDKFRRAKPSQWMKFTNAKMAINLVLLQEKSTRLGIKLQRQLYINDRCPGRKQRNNKRPRFLCSHEKLKF